MYAVIATGGKQYRVNEGDRLRVEKLTGSVGETVVFEEVLLTGGNGEPKIGTPKLSGAKVEAVVAGLDDLVPLAAEAAAQVQVGLAALAAEAQPRAGLEEAVSRQVFRGADKVVQHAAAAESERVAAAGVLLAGGRRLRPGRPQHRHQRHDESEEDAVEGERSRGVWAA